MKRLLSFFIILMIFSGCYYFYPNALKRKKETYATYIEHISFVRGGSNNWGFYDNGKRYSVVAWEPPSKVSGEKYIIIYDSLHPGRNYFIDDTRRVFAPGEITGKTICTIVDNDCFTPKDYGDVEFEYYVDDIYYRRGQFLPRRNRDTLCVKKGDKFEGEYWKENPKRVIIYLDKPIKD